jgi:hypothetical protein
MVQRAPAFTCLRLSPKPSIRRPGWTKARRRRGASSDARSSHTCSGARALGPFSRGSLSCGAEEARRFRVRATLLPSVPERVPCVGLPILLVTGEREFGSFALEGSLASGRQWPRLAPRTTRSRAGCGSPASAPGRVAAGRWPLRSARCWRGPGGRHHARGWRVRAQGWRSSLGRFARRVGRAARRGLRSTRAPRLRRQGGCPSGGRRWPRS